MEGNSGISKEAGALYQEVRSILIEARQSAYRAVNFAMVQAYWRIGYLIVEHEQAGMERAEYGKALLEEVSVRLRTEFGKGFDVTNLRKMRQFYLLFSKRDALRLKFDGAKRGAERPEFKEIAKPASAPGHYLLD